MAITLTAAASRQVESIIADNKLVDHVVRVGVKVDPETSSWDYELDLVDEVSDSDRTFASGDLKVVCDPQSYLWLNGTEIDWAAGAGGFKFNNPLEC